MLANLNETKAGINAVHLKMLCSLFIGGGASIEFLFLYTIDLIPKSCIAKSMYLFNASALDEIDIGEYQAKMEALNETLFAILTESDLYGNRLFFNNLLSISRGSSIFSIQTPGVDGTDLMMALDNKGVYVSTGSACSAGDTKPSHVLKAIGLTDEQALQTIRISLSKHNTVKEIIEGSKILTNTIKELT
jgi:cysteine sulfinate desulfinase/cysteine desulfurase-like protein